MLQRSSSLKRASLNSMENVIVMVGKEHSLERHSSSYMFISAREYERKVPFIIMPDRKVG